MPQDSAYENISLAALRALDGEDLLDIEIFVARPDGEQAVLYRRAGVGLSTPDYERLAENGVSDVQIRVDDFRRCEETLESRLADILKNPHISPIDKVRIVHGTGTTVVGDLMDGPMSHDDLSRATSITECMVDYLLSDARVSTHLLEMAEHERTTASHMFVVSALAVLLGAEIFGPDRKMLWSLGLAGMLHDMGKLSIPAEILNKSTPLTRQEIDLIQRHPVESVRLIGDEPNMTPLIRRFILQHHERVDGAGYPVGAKGDELLPGSRVLTIVDSFHAMVGRRNYRKPMGAAEANRVMATQSGRQFDADLLDAWIALCDKEQIEPEKSRGNSVPRADDMPSHKHEHKPKQPPPKLLGQRQPRHECRNGTLVRCVHVGRLEEVTGSPEEFTALVHDLSRGGLCVLTAGPMFRGEVINIKISSHGEDTWVQGVVAWCRHKNPNVCKVGVQFLKRIASSDRFAIANVIAMNVSRGKTDAQAAAAASAPHSEAAPSDNRRTRVLSTLAAIGSTRRPGREAQQTAVTLAMSGDIVVRLKALDVLIGLGSSIAREALAALVADSHREVRECALQGVASLKVFEAKDAVRKILHDPNEEVALRAAGTLGRLGDKSGLALVRKMLKSDAPICRLAAKVLGEIVGSKFSANREGVKRARSYLANKEVVGIA